jgi:ribonucleotide reductase alpha subunit
MLSSTNQTQQISIQYEKIHKKKRSRKEIHHAFSNKSIKHFDQNYLKIHENKRNQIREAMFTLVSQLNSLQVTIDTKLNYKI